MLNSSSRRQFLGILAAAVPAADRVLAETQTSAAALGFPIVDYHVHLNPTFSLADAVALSATSHVKFGIAEHAGTKENNYPSIASNDDELRQWVAKLSGQPVYKGIQAEWIDWVSCFSKKALSEVDYVLSDAMTMAGSDGRRAKMWLHGFDPGDASQFMDRYVRWNVEVIEREPLDTLAFECLVYRENDRLLIVAIFIARSGTDFDDASNDYLIGVGDDVVKARPGWVSLREQ